MLSSLGGALRSFAKRIDQVGAKLQEQVVIPKRGHRRIIAIEGEKPSIAQGSWVAPNATVIGTVDMGVHSSVWYGAVVRADVNKIKIGSLTSIGDRSTVHVSSGSVNQKGAFSTTIGDRVTIEEGVILHGCTIQDNVKVGSGSIVYDGAVVESNSIIESGSIVTEGKKIPSGELWAGTPAKFVRKLTPQEIESIGKTAETVQALAAKHDKETSKSWQERYEENFKDNRVKERVWETHAVL